MCPKGPKDALPHPTQRQHEFFPSRFFTSSDSCFQVCRDNPQGLALPSLDMCEVSPRKWS